MNDLQKLAEKIEARIEQVKQWTERGDISLAAMGNKAFELEWVLSEIRKIEVKK